jgi:prepilin-type N-terminal cleavage/methylation domain-containing protein/prepilin-type processing-associated H-X9-DG protein
MSNRRAFSLPELLVVVGIIAILIGVLLPTLSKARAQANKVRCAANLTDLGRAFQMYLNDSKGRVPQVNGMPGRVPAVTDAPSVLEVFGTYTSNNKQIWRCPSDRAMNVDPSFPAGKESYFDAFGLSYEYNSWMNSLHGGGTFKDALDTAKKAPFMVDVTRFRIFNDFSHFHGKPGVNGNMNFLFADWHVGDIGEALSGSDLSPGT